MARRCTTTLLMMAYLASQLAMVPHAHGASGENQPCDHNARPHVHVACFDHVGHSHDDGHTHHQECVDSNSLAAVSDTSTRQDDHDSDAVYLPNDPWGSLPTKSVASSGNLQVISTLVTAVAHTPTAISECLSDVNSPDECSPGCPLYLALRALRI